MGNIFANSVSDMELIFRIINNSYNSTTIKKKKPRRMGKELK